jgi:hypothetical protein
VINSQQKETQETHQDFSKPLLPDDEKLSLDNEEDKDEPCPFDFRTDFFDNLLNKQSGKAPLTYDDLLYHPCEDELNQTWAQKTLGGKKGGKE